MRSRRRIAARPLIPFLILLVLLSATALPVLSDPWSRALSGSVSTSRPGYPSLAVVSTNATGTGGGGSTLWTLSIWASNGFLKKSTSGSAPAVSLSMTYDLKDTDPQGLWTANLTTAQSGATVIASRTFWVDYFKPGTPTILIDDGAPATNTTAAVLFITAPDNISFVADMLLANTADFAGASWAPLNATPPWTLSGIDGTVTVYLKVRDVAGNEAGAVSDTILLDRVAPTALSILLQGGLDYTGGRNVTVTLDAKDNRSGVAMMGLSESTTPPASLVPYNTTSIFPLSAGDGTKKVGFWAFDLAGNRAGPAVDTIVLDESGPTNLSIVLAAGAAFTKDVKVRADVSAMDTLSGPLTMRLATEPSFAGATLLDYATVTDFTLAGPDGMKAVFLEVTDSVGNTAEPATDTVVLDRTPPRTSMPALAAAQSTAAFPVAWTGDDLAGSEPGAIAIYEVEDQIEGAGTWSPWLKTTDRAAIFNGTDGMTYLFRVRGKDVAGNVEPFRSTPDARTSVAVDPGIPVVSADPMPAIVSGIARITGNASDDQAVLAVEIAFDGGNWGPVGSFNVKTVAWVFTWSTDTVSPGNHTISLRAFDGLHHSAVQTIATRVVRLGSGLEVRISAETKSLESGESTPLQVAVSIDGAPVAGVLVSFDDTGGSVTPASGLTDVAGVLAVSYTAPGGIVAQTLVTVTATASAAGLSGEDRIDLDVVPPNTLAVSVFLNTSEVGPAGAVSVIAHVVFRGSPVQASILLKAPEGGFTVIAGTGDAAGNLASVFTAGSDPAYRRFNITVTASLAGANDGKGSAALTIARPPPTCTFLSPAEGAKDLRAVVEVRGTCSPGTAKVEYQVDGGAWTPGTGTVTWKVDWDTTKVANGQHAIAVRGDDGVRTGREAVRQLSVSNPSGFTPLVFVTLPTEGSTVKGKVLVQGTAFHPANLPITTVFLRVDSRRAVNATAGASWSLIWDSSAVADGSHALRVWVSDGQNASAEAVIHVTVRNGARASGAGAWVLGLLAVVIAAGVGTAIAAYTIVQRRKVTAIVEDVFLVHKDGRLIAHETRRLKPEIDDQMMGGMLAALQDFVKSSFKVQGKKKRREVGEIALGEYRILLEHGTSVFLGAVSHEHGSVALRERMRKAIKRIEVEFGETLAGWDGDTDKVAGCGEIVREELFG